MNSKISFLLLAACVSTQSFAGESVERTIKSMSCANGQRVCTIEVAGDVLGPRECPSTQLAFKLASDNNGDAVFSLLSSAFFANKKVRFTLSDQCIGSGEPKPTFEMVQVLN